MAKFKPFRVLESQLNDLPIVDGQMIITTDTNKIYIDIDTVRKEYSGTEIDLIAITNEEIDEMFADEVTA